ncbi:MAG: Gfo/Idh/MocA family oxidoreductase [Gemmatimonadaceae bacterium]|jgi:predicted dehydrogenase|nr:Gfo/Idh/MocA family oxidoreductase [Gemmatimonadaceae bacterium]
MNSRRDFVSTAAALGAGVMIVPRHVLGGPGYIAPSDKLRVACIGVGGMGRNDVRGMESETIVALCDVDWSMAGDAFQSYPQARRYKDYRELFDKEREIDVVTVSTPDHMHAPITLRALREGKHVYTQKPLARTVGEVRAIVAEAKARPKQVTQMGNQGHALEGVRQLREMIEAGLIGTVERVECWTDRPIWPQGMRRPTDAHNVPPTLDWNLWLGAAPERPYHPGYAPFNWRGYWDFGTGAMGDMACHIMDAPYWILGLKYPTRVIPDVSPLFEETAPRSSRVEYTFPARGDRPAVTVVWRDGNLRPARPFDWPLAKSWPFDGSGQLWVGTKGTIVAGTYGENPRLSDETKQAAHKAAPPPVKYPRTKGVFAEWTDAIRNGGRAGSDFICHAGPLTEMIVLGNLSVRTGRVIELDPETGALKTQGIPTEFITPTYRPGW